MICVLFLKLYCLGKKPDLIGTLAEFFWMLWCFYKTKKNSRRHR